MSVILNIDSSLENASVSISRNGIVEEFLTNEIQKDHSSFLHTAVERLLTSVSLSPKGLDAIAVTSGPGSYTGLRVGFAAAKGFAYTLSKPLISVGTLEVMAKAAILNNPELNGLIVPMIDARRAEVFTAIYDNKGGEIVPPHALILNDGSFVTELQAGYVSFCGNGSQKFQQLTKHSNARYIEHGEIISTLSALSYKKFMSKKFEELSLSVPLYVKEFYGG